MQFDKSKVRVYPSANSSDKSFKINSEYNLSNITQGLVRNKIIQGLIVTSDASKIKISNGKCMIGGYVVHLYEGVELDIPAIKGILCLILNRENDGYNLLGMSSELGNESIYLGLELGVIPEDTYNTSINDVLPLALVDYSSMDSKVVPIGRSTTTLRASDIYVTGNNESSLAPSESINASDELNKSNSLDKYLANFIISDGQTKGQ